MVRRCSAGLSDIVADVHEGIWRFKCSNGVKNVRKLFFTKSGTKTGTKTGNKMVTKSGKKIFFRKKCFLQFSSIHAYKDHLKVFSNDHTFIL